MALPLLLVQAGHPGYPSSSFDHDPSTGDHGGETRFYDKDNLRPGTAAWFIAHRLDPVHSHTRMSVLQMAYLYLSWKETYVVTDECFMAAVRIAESAMPRGNKFPKSLHLMQKIVGVQSLQLFEHHICPEGDHYRWEPLPRSEWKAHEHDCCPRCLESGKTTTRFTKDASKRLVPRKVGTTAFDTVACTRVCSIFAPQEVSRFITRPTYVLWHHGLHGRFVVR